jgi:serine/threonine protein kinase
MMVTPSVKLVRPLGEGGMGAVWVAEHLALRTQVVVKFIATGLKSNKEAQDRFSREAAAASQVKSPHVVQTFDHGITDEGVPYIVMELLEGRDLGQYLDQEGGKMPSDLVVEVMGQLARALDRAHERGIIHRDIKPGNIYLCDAGRGGEVFVKLLDFGIAKGVDVDGPNRVDSGTKTGSMIGSPFYMSPEQILGSKDLDHRSDLWSVGVVCFEMLTGRKPFDAETMGGLAIRIHSEPLPLPTVVNPDLPIAVDAWFARACARNVNARYGTAKEMTEELARALGGEMPKSLDLAPRLSTGPSSGSRGVNPVAATLAAGAATDAGVVRERTQSRSRSRLLVLLAIFVVVPLATFAVFRTLFKHETATALVPADPSASAHGASAGGSATPGASTAAGANGSTGPGNGTATATGSGAAAAGSAPTADTAAVATTAKVPTHGIRVRPVGSVHTAASTSTSPLPSPPVTSTTTPRPATSGHDIF